MHKLYTFIVLLTLLQSASIYAQELTVTDFQETINPMIVNMQRRDFNNEICAIVMVEIPLQGVTFHGNTIGDQPFKTNEYWVYLTPGTKFLQIKCPGHYPLKVDFRNYGINGLNSKTIYTMRLKAANMTATQQDADPGANYLILDITPKTGLMVRIDNKIQTVKDGNVFVYLKYGRHTYNIEADGYAAEEGEVEIGPSEKTTKTITLRSIKSALTINSETPGAQIYVNNSLKGIGEWSGNLLSGLYRVEVRKTGYRTAAKTIELSQNDNCVLTIPALAPIYGKINVEYFPAGATVTIDGKEAGTSPDIFQNIITGEHTVAISKPGYHTKQIKVTVNENKQITLKGELYVQSQQQQQTSGICTDNTSVTEGNTINGHEYVDLGLSVKWATHNIGAIGPVYKGEYFAWGEITGKNNENNAYNDVSDIAGNPLYDAARANWGGTWRLPTKDEICELIEKCKWKWIKADEGYRITGPNGNSIFLPANGIITSVGLYLVGYSGDYWSPTHDNSNSRSYNLYFNKEKKHIHQ